MIVEHVVWSVDVEGILFAADAESYHLGLCGHNDYDQLYRQYLEWSTQCQIQEINSSSSFKY